MLVLGNLYHVITHLARMVDSEFMKMQLDVSQRMENQCWGHFAATKITI